MLDEIILKTKQRIEKEKSVKSLDDLKKEVLKLEITSDFPFKKALSEDGMSIIAEVKKASPSRGDIVDVFNYIEIAREYESAGVSAISVLTEPYFFKGDNKYLSQISEEVDVALLRKDFVVDEYMIWQTKLLGGDAVLLIASILDTPTLKKYLDLAHDLGLSAIVEVHDSSEISKALIVGAEIIGVNNRNLKDFSVDVENSISLRRCVSDNTIFISESGIKSKEDIIKLKQNNINAVLIGETIMKSDDKKSLISEFKDV